MLVTDLSDKWVVFNIREDEISGVEVGTVLKGFIPRRQPHGRPQGQLDQSSRRVRSLACDASVDGYDLRTFEVRARPVEELPALRPGMTVIVER